eukprot:11144635-Alexandrium_andersonii.AAC.1
MTCEPAGWAWRWRGWPRLAPPARRRRQAGGSGGTVAPQERPLAPEAPAGGCPGGGSPPGQAPGA